MESPVLQSDPRTGLSGRGEQGGGPHFPAGPGAAGAIRPQRDSRALRKKPVWQVFLEQFKDLLVVILIAAAVISMLSGNVESTIVIFAVLILNAVLGTVQHCKAEKSLESLKAMSAPTARVLRDGERLVIPSAQIVPGDIVELEAGGHGGGRRPHSP